MSGGAVFNQALREVRGLDLLPEAERDLVAALAACRPGPCDLFYALGHEAGLPRAELLRRTAGLYCAFAAGSLADDLIDGDCCYLSNVGAVGPSVQFGLQHLAYAVLLRSTATSPWAAHMAHDLARAAASEHLEAGEPEWGASRFIAVAEGIAGLQWQAYLPVLWAGSGRDDDAPALGRALGLALHVVEDIRSGDRRFVSLSTDERHDVCRLALDATILLVGSMSPCLRSVGATLRAELLESLTR